MIEWKTDFSKCENKNYLITHIDETDMSDNRYVAVAEFNSDFEDDIPEDCWWNLDGLNLNDIGFKVIAFAEVPSAYKGV